MVENETIGMQFIWLINSPTKLKYIVRYEFPILISRLRARSCPVSVSNELRVVRVSYAKLFFETTPDKSCREITSSRLVRHSVRCNSSKFDLMLTTVAHQFSRDFDANLGEDGNGN